MLWLALNRERIFVRDPVASVYRNDVKQDGVEVYFNFSNDILLQQNVGDAASTRTITAALGHDAAGDACTSLTCLRWLVCLTPADHAPTLPVAANNGKPYDPKATIDGREINFTDPAGVLVRSKAVNSRAAVGTGLHKAQPSGRVQGLVLRNAIRLSKSVDENLLAKDGMGGFPVGMPVVTVMRTLAAPTLSMMPISDGKMDGTPCRPG